MSKREKAAEHTRILIAIFYFVFLIEIILGCNGHWFYINISGFQLTLRMIFFAIFCVGYIVYFFRYSKFTSELSPLKITVFLIFLFSLISFIVGGKKYGFSLAWDAFSTKFYVIGLLPLLTIERNKFIKRNTLEIVFFCCCIFVSLSVLILYVFFKIQGWDLPTRRYFLASHLPQTFGVWGIYENGGVFFTSLLFVLYASIIGFCKLLFSENKKMSFYIFWILMEIVFVAAILEGSSRGMEIVLLFSFLVLIIIKMRKNTNRIKALASFEQRESLTIKTLFFLFSAISLIGTGILFASKQGYLSRFSNLGEDAGIQKRINFIAKGIQTCFSFPFFFGKGFGATSFVSEVGDVHLEVDFLELFIDQGFFGFSLWVALLFFFMRNFRHHLPKDYCNSLSCIFVVLAMFLLSFTNPYTTNFFGITTLSFCYCYNSEKNMVPQKKIEEEYQQGYS
jgi:hypothetical protein